MPNPTDDTTAVQFSDTTQANRATLRAEVLAHLRADLPPRLHRTMNPSWSVLETLMRDWYDLHVALFLRMLHEYARESGQSDRFYGQLVIDLNGEKETTERLLLPLDELPIDAGDDPVCSWLEFIASFLDEVDKRWFYDLLNEHDRPLGASR